MEISEFALRLLTSPSLNVKLRRMREPLTDRTPGEAVRIDVPARSDDIRFAGRREAPAMPKAEALMEPARRGIAHHIMANHELQAVEVMAWVLLAFPDAPSEFRDGLVEILADEQRHTQMHAERARALGVPFGSLPVNGYIWRKSREATTLLEYVSGLPLVFEGRNLDHTKQFAEWFRAAGDQRGASVLERIHDDEIEHVRFGYRWLQRLKQPGISDWDAWTSHLTWPLQPAKARGDVFQSESRLAAGMSEEFVARLEQTAAE